MAKIRSDALGLFWNDLPTEKKSEKSVVKLKLNRFWESPDYLPNYAEAITYQGDYFTDAELIAAATNDERLVWDIECYPNYFLIAFKGIKSKKLVYFESIDNSPFDQPKLKWIIDNFCCISFYGIGYDVNILAMALAGAACEQLYWATEQLIIYEVRPQDLLKRVGLERLKFNHIDIIEVAPLRATLKTYGGRIHTNRMQDLPIKPGTILSDKQITVVRWYCFNDLQQTEDLYFELEPQIKLRENLSVEYNQDLRSKSDAQIAEAVLGAEISRLTGRRCKRPIIEPGTRFKYNIPSFMQFQTREMQDVLEIVRNIDFVVELDGSVKMPEELASRLIDFANSDSVYKMGIGGLHSTEKCKTHFATEYHYLIDADVASYYPAIILNQGLFPAHLTEAFLDVYRSLVKRRLAAKKSKDSVTADSIKITINGGFGKFGSMWSILYSPDLMIQVTLTGQLCLLMLIEDLELNGIPVVSANTDGVVSKVPASLLDKYNEILEKWQKVTAFELEKTHYKMLGSRDVNNYIAITTDDEHKVKGAYGVGGKMKLHKNPTGIICSEAVVEFLKNRTPIMATIGNCRDLKKFIHTRSVTGGAVKVWDFDEETGEVFKADYLGKSVRWYYSTKANGTIVYGSNGNNVPKSEGAMPCMILPEEFPSDLNYEWYLAEANRMLHDIGFNS